MNRRSKGAASLIVVSFRIISYRRPPRAAVAVRASPRARCGERAAVRTAGAFVRTPPRWWRVWRRLGRRRRRRRGASGRTLVSVARTMVLDRVRVWYTTSCSVAARALFDFGAHGPCRLGGGTAPSAADCGKSAGRSATNFHRGGGARAKERERESESTEVGYRPPCDSGKRNRVNLER